MGDLHFDVTPATGILYGKVTDSDGFAVDSATVSVNNVSVTTDSRGRYIAAGVESVVGIDGRPTPTEFRNEPIVAIAASKDGFTAYTDTLHFGPTVNNPTDHPVDLSGVTNSIMITGQVTNILNGAGIGRALVLVDGQTPSNAPTRGLDAGKLLTAADGTYSAQIRTKERGRTARVSVSKAGYHFPVGSSPVLADGNSPAVVNFQGYENGTITGTIEGPDGRALASVIVTATSTAEGATTAAATATTNSVGQFSLNVPPVSTYRIDAVLRGHVFSAPNNNWTVFAGPGQTVNFGRIKAVTAGAQGLTAARMRQESDDDASNGDETQRWATTISVKYTATDSLVPTGYNNATYAVQTNTGTDRAWTEATPTPVNDAGGDPIAGSFTIPTPDASAGGDGEFMVRVVTTAVHGTDTSANPNILIESAPVTVAAIDPSATGVRARRQATSTATEADAGGSFIQASWSAVTNDNSDFRVVAQVTAASTGATVWVVLAEASANDRSAVSVEIDDAYVGPLNVATAAGTGASIAVTAAELRAAISIAVESVQGTADATDDGPKWKRSTPASLGARTSGS